MQHLHGAEDADAEFFNPAEGEFDGALFDLGGTTRVSPRLFALLETGDTMVVEVPGRTTGIPLKSLGQKTEAFKRACLAQR